MSIIYRRFLKRIIISLFFSLCVVPAISQSGIPYITYFETREGYEASNWSVCQDDHNAMLFASRRGLIRYDGSEWKFVNVPYIPQIIKQNPYNQKVYIASEHNYGYLERDERGILYYEPLTFDTELTGRLTGIEFTDTSVLFFGDQSVSCHTLRDHRLIYRHMAEDYGSFAGLLSTKQTDYIMIGGEGLYRIFNDTLQSAFVASWGSDREILFSVSHSSSTSLVGTSANELLLFNGKVFEEFKLSNPEYLAENVLSGGLLVNDTTYAFSTLHGGVLLVERKSGKVRHTLNYESGLPDDEIYAMGTDRQGGLWLTYGFGTCRINMGSGVADFSHYQGIEGLLTNIVWHDGELFVSTTEGLYYLYEVKNYEEVEVYLKQKTQAVEEKDSRRKRSDTSTRKGEREQGFFSRLFKRDKDRGNETKTKEEPASKSSETVYVRKKVSKLKSIEHVFRKVEGLNSRCEHLVSTRDGLLVGSTAGLFHLQDHELTLISDSRNIRYISPRGEGGKYYILDEKGITILEFVNGESVVQENFFSITDRYLSMCVVDSSFWMSGFDVVYKAEIAGPDSIHEKTYSIESLYPEELHLSLISDTLFLFSETTIRYYSPKSDSFVDYSIGFKDIKSFSSIRYFPPGAGEQWIKLDQRMVRFSHHSSDPEQLKWGLFENITSFFPVGEELYWIIDDYLKIYRVSTGKTDHLSQKLDIFLENITDEEGNHLLLSNLEFDPSEKILKIKVSAPNFLRDQTTQYQYKNENKMEQWSTWNSNSTLDILLDAGENNVLIRARNIMGEISPPLTVSVVVRKPFYQATWFYLCLIPFVLGFFYLLMYAREKKLRRDKHILELKIEERTMEIQKQKEKIEHQKDKILAQKNDITSSITYASRIQKAILPSKQIFEKTFNDYFVYYQPRDIVSGDFYWVAEFKQEIIFAVADCTGHGVPGAFMSMLGNSFLNEITKGTGDAIPADKILNQLRDMVNSALAQSGDMIKSYDGMDITLCKYNRKKREIMFSGAYNSLHLVRKGILKEYKGDRMPIGFHPKKRDFTSQKIKMEKGDILYLFSDGYQDQFGGAMGKKYTTRQFKQLLAAVSGKPMPEQHLALEKEMRIWQGPLEQVDDILILGLQI